MLAGQWYLTRRPRHPRVDCELVHLRSGTAEPPRSPNSLMIVEVITRLRDVAPPVRSTPHDLGHLTRTLIRPIGCLCASTPGLGALRLVPLTRLLVISRTRPRRWNLFDLRR